MDPMLNFYLIVRSDKHFNIARQVRPAWHREKVRGPRERTAATSTIAREWPPTTSWGGWHHVGLCRPLKGHGMVLKSALTALCCYPFRINYVRIGCLKVVVLLQLGFKYFARMPGYFFILERCKYVSCGTKYIHVPHVRWLFPNERKLLI